MGKRELHQALFIPDGDGFTPTELTRGPWRPDAQHGGPPSALLAHLTRIEPGEFMGFIEIELIRPVPLTHLQANVRREKVSGRVNRVHAELVSEGTVVARSNALLIAETPDLPPSEFEAPPVERPVIPPVEGQVEPPYWASGPDQITYHRDAVEHRFVHGAFRKPGPAFDWARLRQPVVAGSVPTGFERTLAAADFGSGISAIYGFESRVGLINANLAVTFTRQPQGEWIGLDATTVTGPQGTGTGITQLSDQSGPIGIATQTLLGYSIKVR